MLCTCEQVSRGHPDKICDQIADAIVTDCLRHDRDSRVAVECMIKGYFITIRGEITSSYDPCYDDIVKSVLSDIGLKGVDNYRVDVVVSRQSSDIARSVDNGGAGDQGIVYGYATSETPELMPMPFVLATQALRLLTQLGSPLLLPDAKSQVTYDYSNHSIETFLISTQHTHDAPLKSVRNLAEIAMDSAAWVRNQNTDYDILVNPTGRFEIGGSFADTGVTGRKLMCDTYGGICHSGGGALSGKDPTKIDRCGAYMARKIARDIVASGDAERCEVQIAYAIGVPEPVAVEVNHFGTSCVPHRVMLGRIKQCYDLRPQAIIERLGLLDVDYNKVSSFGHFGKKGLPWEK